MGSTPVYAVATLGIGTPKVEDNQVTFPIMLNGAPPEGVAAMDFRFRYDPVALQPVSAEAGAAAVKAGKRIMANVAQPGEYIIVLFGMSNGTGQAVCANGEIARVVMRTKATDALSWGLGITKLTASAADGTEIPARTRPYTGLHSGIVLPIASVPTPEETTPGTDEQAVDNSADKANTIGQSVGIGENPAENVKKNLGETRKTLAAILKPPVASTSQMNDGQTVSADAVPDKTDPQGAEKARGGLDEKVVSQETRMRTLQAGSVNGSDAPKIEHKRPEKADVKTSDDMTTGLEVPTGASPYKRILIAGIGVLAILGIVVGYVKRK